MYSEIFDVDLNEAIRESRIEISNIKKDYSICTDWGKLMNESRIDIDEIKREINSYPRPSLLT